MTKLKEEVKQLRSEVEKLWNLTDNAQVSYGDGGYEHSSVVTPYSWRQPKLSANKAIQLILDHLGLEITDKETSTHKLTRKKIS